MLQRWMHVVENCHALKHAIQLSFFPYMDCNCSFHEEREGGREGGREREREMQA